jgi:hypothetical protein
VLSLAKETYDMAKGAYEYGKRGLTRCIPVLSLLRGGEKKKKKEKRKKEKKTKIPVLSLLRGGGDVVRLRDILKSQYTGCMCY